MSVAAQGGEWGTAVSGGRPWTLDHREGAWVARARGRLWRRVRVVGDRWGPL